MNKVEENKCEKLKKKYTKGRTYLQWFIAITANLNLITYGIQSGWVSPMMKFLQSKDSPTGSPISDYEISWIGSILGLAAAVGVPFYSFAADCFGRKIAILTIAVLQTIGWLIKLSSVNTLTIITARFFCGIATGGCFVVIPMYVKEISQDDIRGLLGSLLIMFQNIGVLIMFAIGAYLDYFTVIWAMIWLPIVTLALMCIAPESPAFLLKSGKIEEAAKTIGWLRRLDPEDEIVQKELDSMKKEDLYFKSLPDVSFLSIFKEKAWCKSFFLMMSILAIHATNGTYSLTTYAATVLTSTSTSALNPELLSLSFPTVMIFAAFVSMSCVERFGRKPVLAASLCLIIISKLCIASVILVQRHGGEVAWWIPLTAMMVCVGAYAFGLSPIPFVMLSEIFNFQIRAKALGVIVTCTWMLSFVQLLIFLPLSASIGLHGAFFFFAGINLIGLFITVVLLPETKGKTVEQIELELSAR